MAFRQVKQSISQLSGESIWNIFNCQYFMQRKKYIKNYKKDKELQFTLYNQDLSPS
jgi:hypothetical protein